MGVCACVCVCVCVCECVCVCVCVLLNEHPFNFKRTTEDKDNNEFKTVRWSIHSELANHSWLRAA